MTWPTVAVTTTNVDAGTDSPATARTDILDGLTKQNQMIAHVSSFMQGHLADTTAAAARTTLGAQIAGSYQAALAYTAADDAAVVKLTGTQTIAGTKTFSTQPVLPQAATLTAAVATTSGTAIDLTGVPTWVKRITLMLNGVSTNGVSTLLVQLGAGSVDVTGYLSTLGSMGLSAGVTAGTLATNGVLVGSINVAADTHYGAVVFNLIGSNTWTCHGVTVRNSGTVQAVEYMSTLKTLSGALDRLRLTTVAGTDTFDAGSINLLLE